MNPCEEIRDSLYNVVFGEADVEQTQIVLAHLDDCPECRELFVKLRALYNGMQEIPQEEPPEELSRNVMESIRRIRAQNRRNRRIITACAAAAAVAVIVFSPGNRSLLTGSDSVMSGGTSQASTAESASNSVAAPQAPAADQCAPTLKAIRNSDAGDDAATGYGSQEEVTGENENQIQSYVIMSEMPAAEDESTEAFYIKIPSGMTSQEVYNILSVKTDENITEIEADVQQAEQIKQICQDNGFETSDQPYTDSPYITVKTAG